MIADMALGSIDKAFYEYNSIQSSSINRRHYKGLILTEFLETFHEKKKTFYENFH